MIDSKVIREIVESYLQGTSYFLVDVVVDKNNSILVEVDSEDNVSLDYCVELSKHIESKLERDIEDYDLEVGSAGITSPFKVLQQYEKYAGEEVEVQEKSGPKYVGILKDVNPETFSLEITKKEKREGEKKKVDVVETLTFTYEQIKYTKYIIRFK